MARGTLEGEDITSVGTLVFPCPYLRSPMPPHQARNPAERDLLSWLHAPRNSSKEESEKEFPQIRT